MRATLQAASCLHAWCPGDVFTLEFVASTVLATHASNSSGYGHEER